MGSKNTTDISTFMNITTISLLNIENELLLFHGRLNSIETCLCNMYHVAAAPNPSFETSFDTSTTFSVSEFPTDSSYKRMLSHSISPLIIFCHFLINPVKKPLSPKMTENNQSFFQFCPIFCFKNPKYSDSPLLTEVEIVEIRQK